MLTTCNYLKYIMKIVEKESISDEKIKDMLLFSNKYVSDTTTEKGVIVSMCTIEEFKY